MSVQSHYTTQDAQYYSSKTGKIRTSPDYEIVLSRRVSISQLSTKQRTDKKASRQEWTKNADELMRNLELGLRNKVN